MSFSSETSFLFAPALSMGRRAARKALNHEFFGVFKTFAASAFYL
jgi:hypothetical protein